MLHTMRDHRPAPSAARDALLVLFVVSGYAIPLALLLLVFGVVALDTIGRSLPYAARNTLRDILGVTAGVTGLAAWIVALVKGYRHARAGGRGRFIVAMEVLALGVLVAWGLFINHAMLKGTFIRSSCDSGEPFRVLAEPEVMGLALLHGAVVWAYVVSRRRPEALRPMPEALVHGTLLAGLVLHGALAVQFADVLPLGLVVAPLGLPVIAPYVTVALLGRELLARLRRRGAEAPIAHGPSPDSVYRVPSGGDAPPTLEPTVHVPTLIRGLIAMPAVLGAYAVMQTVVFHGIDAATRVITRTAGHPLSGVAIETLPVHDCHYLCTVAAGGHPWLVQPERVGQRNGHPILVNRQLAVANAFEDLLHTRWPRFGRLCRRIYDRLGLPVSRYIRTRAMADVVYLAMKPFEWMFYAVLLALDPGDPEQRIARMYR